MWNHKVVTSHFYCFRVSAQEAGLTCVITNIQLLKMVLWLGFSVSSPMPVLSSSLLSTCSSRCLECPSTRLTLVWLHFTNKVSNQMPLFQGPFQNTLNHLLHTGILCHIDYFLFFSPLKLNNFFLFPYLLPSYSTIGAFREPVCSLSHSGLSLQSQHRDRGNTTWIFVEYE